MKIDFNKTVYEIVGFIMIARKKETNAVSGIIELI
tara:strand:+ start:563 stop:667 length:105 start_codon:yes stop_codon:yes gene_type:complete